MPLFSSPAGGGLGGGLGGGGGGGRKGSGPAAFRLTEKFVLLLVFSAFITLCFGAIFFLPDSSKLLSGVLFHSSPALQSVADHKPGPGGRAEDPAEGRARHGDEGALGDPAAALEDNLARIRENHERALREAKETLQKLPEEIQRDILLEKEKVAQDQLRDKAVFRGQRVKRYGKELRLQDDCEVHGNMLASSLLRSVSLKFFHLVCVLRFFCW